MRNILVHGCYDQSTLKTLASLGIRQVGFDLRASSPNLVPFQELVLLLKNLIAHEIVLIFHNDRMETVLSFVDLLRNEGFKVLLEFRDQREISYYHSIGHPFLWMFAPEADWRGILMLPTLNGVLLPLKWKSLYQQEKELWEIIEQRDLKVFLHAEDFEEAASLDELGRINLSLDLTSEVETSYRCVDQERLKRMELWSKLLTPLRSG